MSLWGTSRLTILKNVNQIAAIQLRWLQGLCVSAGRSCQNVYQIFTGLRHSANCTWATVWSVMKHVSSQRTVYLCFGSSFKPRKPLTVSHPRSSSTLRPRRVSRGMPGASTTSLKKHCRNFHLFSSRSWSSWMTGTSQQLSSGPAWVHELAPLCASHRKQYFKSIKSTSHRDRDTFRLSI